MQLNEVCFAQIVSEDSQWQSLICQKIPEELITQIFQELDEFDVAGRVCLVCRKWKRIAQDDVIWRGLYQREFHTLMENISGISWKRLYASTTIGRKILHHLQSNSDDAERRFKWNNQSRIRNRVNVVMGNRVVECPRTLSEIATEVDLIVSNNGHVLGIEAPVHSSYTHYFSEGKFRFFPNLEALDGIVKMRFQLVSRSDRIGSSFWLDPERRDSYILVRESLRFEFWKDPKYIPEDFCENRIRTVHRFSEVQERAFNHYIQQKVELGVQHNMQRLTTPEMMELFQQKSEEMIEAGRNWDKWFYPVCEFYCDADGLLYSPGEPTDSVVKIVVIGLHQLVSGCLIPTWTYQTYRDYQDSQRLLPQDILCSNVLFSTIHRVAEHLLGCHITLKEL